MFLCTSSVDMSREADLLESENCEIELVLDVLCCNIIAIEVGQVTSREPLLIERSGEVAPVESTKSRMLRIALGPCQC